VASGRWRGRLEWAPVTFTLNVMSVVAFCIRETRATAEVITAVRAVTAASMAEIGMAIESAHPVYEAEIFGNSWEVRAGEMRALVTNLAAIGVEARITENGREITAAILENILSESEAIARDEERLDEEGDA
jgi:hypothetical protein